MGPIRGPRPRYPGPGRRSGRARFARAEGSPDLDLHVPCGPCGPRRSRIRSRREPMARKKSSPPDETPPGKADAAGMLATFAAGVLGQPASRAHEVSLKLGRSEREILVGVPELDVKL